MPFLPPNQQRQSTEGTNFNNKPKINLLLPMDNKKSHTKQYEIFISELKPEE